MILSMSGQAWLFLSTIAAGFVIGFAYDIFRILRKTIPHRAWVVQIEDILYWTSVSLLMFYFMLNRNYGEIRLFAIAGAALGVVLYYVTLSPLIMKVSMAVIRFLQKIIRTAIKIICTPIRAVARVLRKILRPPARYIYHYIKSKRKYIKVMLKKV